MAIADAAFATIAPMTDRRFQVGETVLVSRDESGENHEEATVVDFYELLIGEDKRPMVVVDLADGERRYMTALEPNVIAIEPEEAGAAEAAAGGDGEGSAEERASDPEDGDAP